MENFKKTFSSNGYPKALIVSCINTFLDRIYNTKNKVHTCSKKIVYFCLSLDIMVYISVHNLVKFLLLLRDRSLFMEGGGGGIRGGGICINKLLEGGAIKFFQENEGGLQLNLKEFA